jgi:glucose/mannose transport system substrate-binding protein
MKVSHILIGVVILCAVIATPFLLLIPPAPPPAVGLIENIIRDVGAGGDLEITHWWTIAEEARAFDVAKEGMRDQYPNVNIIPMPVAGGAGGALTPLLLPALLARRPPESFQANLGYQVLAYEGFLRDLSDLWEYANLEERTPEIIRRISRKGDRYKVVPIGVHRTNVVWYNKDLFARAGITPPTGTITFSEFWALCGELRRRLPAGTHVLDLGSGLGTIWAATQVFESIMAGLDLQTYEDFINGIVTPEQLKPVLEQFNKYLTYVPADYGARNWAEVGGLMFMDGVAMYLHGDWLKGYFRVRGWRYGVDYGSFIVAETPGIFGLCLDGFVVPRDARYIANGLRWVYSFTTEAVQREFNLEKGSVSPFTDIPLEIYEDVYSREAARSVQDPATRFFPSITHGTAVPNDVVRGLHPKISGFVLERDVTAFAHKIVAVVREGTFPIVWDIVP